jgi:multimeric flavodoxin WrbA
MKTVIINGSPRRNGNTVTLIEEFKKHVDGEVVEVSTYYRNVKPCIDCRYCWKYSGCAVNDDMQDIYEEIEDADNVILASPLNFSELTGSLLGLASRFQCYYAARVIRKDKTFSMKKKKGFLFLVGGGDSKNTGKAEETARIILREINADLSGVVRSIKTDKLPASEDADALEAIKNIALGLNNNSLQQ